METIIVENVEEATGVSARYPFDFEMRKYDDRPGQYMASLNYPAEQIIIEWEPTPPRLIKFVEHRHGRRRSALKKEGATWHENCWYLHYGEDCQTPLGSNTDDAYETLFKN